MTQMIPLDEALATVDRALAGRLIETETLPVAAARGRFLAEDQVARLDLPPFNKSAMDGYAVMADDEQDSYRVLECVAAGQVPTQALSPGTATKIMTGAPAPDGAGRVIMVEDTDGGDETVHITTHRDKSNICLQGEDVQTGQVIMTAGTRLNALAIANLVSCGITWVCVRRPVRVALYATGDEIVDTFEDVVPGKIMNSNGPMLAALAEEQGLEIIISSKVSDDPASLATALAQAHEADLILLSGGVSAGDFDFVPGALKEAGFEIQIESVAVQPGKPVTFATRPNQIALGMPGNPVSVYLSFQLYVRRIVAMLSGAPVPMRWFEVALAAPFKRKRGKRTAFVPCTLNEAGQAELLPYHGSAHLLALGSADGFLEITQGTTEMDTNSKTRFFPWASGRW